MTTSAKIKLTVFIILVFVLVVIALFDVRFVSSPGEVTREGIIIDDSSLAESLSIELGKKGIPFELEKKNGQTSLTWDKEFTDRANRIKRRVLNIRPPNKRGRCFYSIDSKDQFLVKLNEALIKYDIEDRYDGAICVRWAIKDDDEVLKIDPRIKELRLLNK